MAIAAPSPDKTCTWWDKEENGAQLQLPLTAFHCANSWSDYS